MGLLKVNFWEMERTPLVQRLGALLALLQLITAFHWLNQETGPNLTICWPFFSNCSETPILTPGLSGTLHILFLVASALAILVFLLQRFPVAGWTLFLFSTLSMSVLYLSDAKIAADVHGLTLLLSLCLLFIPNKVATARILILVFYFVNSLLKTSPDWLSGVPLETVLHLPHKGLEWVAAVSLLIEMAVPILLLARSGQLLSLGLGILGAYHGAHFWVFRDFASIVDLLLLVFFIFDYFERVRLERESLYQSYEHPGPSQIWWIATAAIYAMIQMPFWPAALPTEVFKVEGQAHHYECLLKAYRSVGTTTSEWPVAISEDLPEKYRCNTHIAFMTAKAACKVKADEKEGKTSDEPARVRVHFLRRGFAETHFREVFAIEDVCRPGTSLPTIARGEQ